MIDDALNLFTKMETLSEILPVDQLCVDSQPNKYEPNRLFGVELLQPETLWMKTPNHFSMVDLGLRTSSFDLTYTNTVLGRLWAEKASEC